MNILNVRLTSIEEYITNHNVSLNAELSDLSSKILPSIG